MRLALTISCLEYCRNHLPSLPNPILFPLHLSSSQMLAILIPACASSSLVFHMIYSAYKSNKHSDSTQPWHTPFPIWNQSVVPCPVLTVASWSAYRFRRRQVRWFDIPVSWRFFHSLLWATQSKAVIKAEVDVFLELSCFFYDPTDVGNLISASSAFSKSSLNILKVHGSRTVEAWLGVFWALLC